MAAKVTMNRYMQARKKPLGEGSRFKALAAEAEKGGADNPAAVAAAAGIKKYGKKRMAKMALAGRMKKEA